jgi:glycosyltransferase involved in cell wall biosynthesis
MTSVGDTRCRAEHPRVTVLVTVHRRTEFLEQALSSVVNQTLRGVEVIVVDDSGNAAARAICAPFITNHGFVYKANSITLGVAESLRAAIHDAKGRYLAILNDDDVWSPEFLEHLVPVLEANPDVVLGFSDHWIMKENGELDLDASETTSRIYGRSHLVQGRIFNPVEFVLRHNGVPLAMAAVFRKDALDLELLTSRVGGAYDFWISCMLARSRGDFYFEPKRLTAYRVHSGMETARRSPQKSDAHVYLFSQLLESDWFPDWRNHLRSKLSRTLCRAGRDRLRFGRNSEARRLSVAAFRVFPGWRPLAVGALSLLPQKVCQRLGQAYGW